MIKHHKTDIERLATIRAARLKLYGGDESTLADSSDRETDALLEVVQNLLGRVRMLEAREGTDRQ